MTSRRTGPIYSPTMGSACNFIDDEMGLYYLRVPTWGPFRLQFCGNAHGSLARQ